MFGPSSVTWRVHSDPLLRLAVLRFLLLQALHPAAAAAQTHARQGSLLWERVERTVDYLGMTTFGSRQDAMTAAARLRAVHACTVGATPEGRPYSASDIELQKWVLDSILEVVTRGGLLLDAGDEDAYVEEQVRAAVLVGLEPDEVPHSRWGVTLRIRCMRPTLRETPEARSVALTVICAGVLDPVSHEETDGCPEPCACRVSWRAASGLAFATLPCWARHMYTIPVPDGPASLEGSAATLALQSLRRALRGVSGAP
jgi:uncharacterized protein (DUF2236 family)